MEYLELLMNKTKMVNIIFCLGALGFLMSRENSLEFEALHARDLCRYTTTLCSSTNLAT